MTEDEVVFNDRWPDLKTKSCYTVLESLAYSLVFSAWCVFSPFHTQTTPTSSSLPLHPVDAPNKATCVVSGCLGERSPHQAACLCLSRDHLHAFSPLLCLVFLAIPSFPSPDLPSVHLPHTLLLSLSLIPNNSFSFVMSFSLFYSLLHSFYFSLSNQFLHHFQ